MKWEGQPQSDNVEDRRGDTGGGGGGGFGFGGRSIGIGTIVLALIGGWVFGIDPMTLLGALSGGGSVTQTAPRPTQAPAAKGPPHDPQAVFVSTVLADTEQVWTSALGEANVAYPKPKLVLFRGSTPTACGRGESAMGPFYCPGDQRVYIDLDFFDTLSRRLGAPGDFAQAYVIAHEVGHHVQHVLGIMDKVDAARSRASPAQANAISVRLELQADCFAGVWAQRSNRSKGWLEQGDIEEALNAASQIGDDTLQRRSRGTVVPESFTHGTSAQRVSWFKRGLQNGAVRDCDTLKSQQP